MADFSPSEVVFLRGEEFAKPATRWEPKVSPLAGETKLSAGELARAAVSAALLANERESALRFVEGEKKTMMGLSTAQALFVERDTATPEWPAGSLEARILSVVDRLAEAKDRVEVSDLVYNLFSEDTPGPSNVLLDTINAGLVDRDLVEEVERRKWKFFVSKHYELPERTEELIAEADVPGVHQLLAEAENARPAF